ncbi:MAG: glycosyltransferase family 1 protein [Proteobacteria bacterium]|nr:glycosyltransferase family 1 protein [Pseudomonadota bacterium]
MNSPVDVIFLAGRSDFAKVGEYQAKAPVIIDLIDDTNRRQALGPALQAHVRTQFSWDDAAGILERTYASVLTRRVPSRTDRLASR